MRLTILGTSAPYPRPDNPCSGYLVQHGKTSIWVDAGTGTLAELQRHVALDGLDAIWISHAHADHCADLLTAYYALRFGGFARESPIPLIGPPGLVDRMVGFLGHRSAAIIPEVFDIIEMRGWEEAVIGELALGWGPVDHGVPAFGLRFEVAGSVLAHPVLAYSGDSAYCEGLVELAAGADLFLCEAGSSASVPGEAAAHCTPEDAARIAREAGSLRLVLTHVAAEDAWQRAVAGFPVAHLAVAGEQFIL
jgi:ribonuclease BN (tRNA processing enzyme)